MTTPSKSKIYTKTGDQGKTRLVGGLSVDKFDLRVEAYGTADELNSYLGVVRSVLADASPLTPLEEKLLRVQNELFNLGSQLACEDENLSKQLPLLSSGMIAELEKSIDEMDSALIKLNQFILPAGHAAAAHLHYARTLCRRAERRTAELQSRSGRFSQELIFLNRLSDFFFVAARWANARMGEVDVIWKKQI